MSKFSKALIFMGLIIIFAACNKDICPANNGSHMELMNPMKSVHPAINSASISAKVAGHVVN